MIQKAEEGHYPGKAPLGYLNHREHSKSLVVLDPDRALLVRSLFELYDAGSHTLDDLVVHAAHIGLRASRGGKLQRSSVHVLLRNPLYGGTFIWGKKIYKSADPRIVSIELWQRVQDRLDGKPMTRPGNREFAFAGMMTCGHCGATITAEIKKERYVYYHCGQRCTDDRYLREEQVSDLLGDTLRPLRLPEEEAAEVARTLRDSRREIQAEQRQRVAIARSRYDLLTSRISRAYEDKLDGKIDDAFFQRQRGAWELEQAHLQEEMERLARVDSQSLDTAIRVFELANRAFEVYNRADLAGRRRVLDLVLSNCELRSGAITPTYREPFDLLAEIGSAENSDGAESANRTLRRPVWSACVDVTRTFSSAPDPEVRGAMVGVRGVVAG